MSKFYLYSTSLRLKIQCVHNVYTHKTSYAKQCKLIIDMSFYEKYNTLRIISHVLMIISSIAYGPIVTIYFQLSRKNENVQYSRIKRAKYFAKIFLNKREIYKAKNKYISYIHIFLKKRFSII